MKPDARPTLLSSSLSLYLPASLSTHTHVILLGRCCEQASDSTIVHIYVKPAEQQHTMPAAASLKQHTHTHKQQHETQKEEPTHKMGLRWILAKLMAYTSPSTPALGAMPAPGMKIPATCLSCCVARSNSSLFWVLYIRLGGSKSRH